MWRKPGIISGLPAAIGAGNRGIYRELCLGVLPRRDTSVTELKKLNLARVFNDYDFGGVDHNAA